MAGAEIGFQEMCARYHVTARTLRYYEFLGLLSPRRVGRARWYGRCDRTRLSLILRGRRFGFSLEEIRRWLDLYDEEGPQEQLRAWVALADRKLQELIGRQRELARIVSELQRLRDLAGESLAHSV